jgi:hypothetical protein
MKSLWHRPFRPWRCRRLDNLLGGPVKAKPVGLLDRRPEPEAKPKVVEEETKPPTVTKPDRNVWSSVTVPKGASDIEALTFVPGLVGEIVEWIVAGAKRPNRVMALGVALGVVGTLIGRRVEGPTGSSTHLYVFILAPTGYGKDWPLWCGQKLMIAVGAKGLLGPHEFVSGQGFKQFLKRNPLTICFVDELGDMFALINNQQGNPFIKDLMGLFKKLYNAWSIIITAEKVHEESVTINHPAVTIIGACTPISLFENLLPGDIEGGFANRPMLLPFEGSKRPPERDVREGAEEPPRALVERLKGLLGPERSLLDAPMASELKPEVPKTDRQRLGWGSPEAKAAYYAFSGEMDKWEGSQRYELAMRTTENAVRCATIVAAGRGSAVVELRDIEWAMKWARVSFEAACGGFEKYMRKYFEFPKFCDEFVAALEGEAEGFLSDRDIERRFGRNQRFGNELERVKAQLQREVRIEKCSRAKSRGPAALGWRLVEGKD